MITRYGFIDPGAIMGVVVSLIILAVGVFAFFVTIQNIPTGGSSGVPAGPTNWDSGVYNASINGSQNAIGNVTNTGNTVFNIVGIVLVIGAIMSIVGLVYNYVR